MSTWMKSVVLASALGAVSNAAWVPATHKTVDVTSKRDINATLAAALKPAHNANLLYIDDSAPAQNMAINVNAEHNTNQYIVIEEFRDLITKMTCSKDPTNADITDVNLNFQGPDVFTAAQKYWSTDAELKDGQFLFITHDPDCSSNGQRVVYCSNKIRFDQATNSAVITASAKELGYDSDASSALTVSGGSYQASPSLQKRILGFGTPGDDDYKSGTKGTDLPLDIQISQKTLISTDLLTLTCYDCHLTGQLSPAFQYRFLTDTEFLINKAAQGKFNEIVTEATLNISATKDISAALDFNVKTKQSVDFTCTYPYGECGVSIDGVGIGSKSNSLLGDGGFKIGPFQLNLFAALGITIEAHMAALIAMNWTASMDVPSGQFDSFDFLDTSKSQNTFHPEFHADTPSIEMEDIEACITIGLGGQFNAGVAFDVAGHNYTAVDINVDAFVPKVVFCADDNKKSNDKCDGPGSTHVHHYNSTLTIGTDLSGTLLNQHASTGDSLEAHFPLFDKCDVQSTSSSAVSSATPTTKASASTAADVTSAVATTDAPVATDASAATSVTSANAAAVASAIASIVAGMKNSAAHSSPMSTPCTTTGFATSTPAAATGSDAPNDDLARRYARLARYARY